MNTEEKAKAYDEALKIAKNILESRCVKGTAGSFYRKDIEQMFPVLEDSDYEKIRKDLIDYFHGAPLETPETEVLAWLERQKQKPTEWSGEDEDRLNKLVWELKQKKQKSELGLSTGYSPKFWEETIMWLKSLKYRVLPQPKQDRNVSDYSCWETVVAAFSECAGKSVSKDEWLRCNDWLYSVHPMKQWKPTEEQMRVLALSFAGVYREEDIKTLRALYEDLKEL